MVHRFKSPLDNILPDLPVGGPASENQIGDSLSLTFLEDRLPDEAAPLDEQEKPSDTAPETGLEPESDKLPIVPGKKRPSTAKES